MDRYVAGITAMFVTFGLGILLVVVVGPILDVDGHTMDVTLKNVSDASLPYRLYVNGELVQQGSIEPGEAAHYQYVKPYGLWNSWWPNTISVVTPHTVHEKDAITLGEDPCFVLD